MNRIATMVALTLCLAAPTSAWAIDDHLLLSEAVMTPTVGEFIEIYNPTAGAIALDNYFLSDDEEYALYPSAVGLSIGSSDFIAQFPAGSMIAAGGVVVVAFDGAGFTATYGTVADYEMLATDPATPDMLGGASIGGSAGLTNGGESAVLFFWDGVSDLVQDVDSVNLGTPSGTNDIGDKTGLTVDGPDADVDGSTYLADLVTIPLMASDAGNGFSNKRLVVEGAAETTGGGNGITGDDETSEDISLTWDGGGNGLPANFTAPNPGVFGGPIITCEDLSGLACSSDCGSNDVSLSWTNGQTYVAIRVFLDGAEIAVLGGDDATYTDLGRASGIYEYSIEGECGAGEFTTVNCTINHCLGAPDDGVVISEIVDSNIPGGRVRWVELTNCGLNTVDLSTYSLGNFNNGSVEIGGGLSILLSGMLTPGESFVIEYDNDVDTRFNEVYGVDPSQFTGGGFINGDDAVALFFGVATTDGTGTLTSGTLLDVYGVIGVDGSGEDWDYTDGYARRNPSVPQSAVFNSTDWLFGGSDSLDGGDTGVDTDDIALAQMLTEPFTHECEGVVPTCEAFVDLTCDSDCMFNDVDLAWTSGEVYLEIRVLRDGVVIATLPGGDTSYMDAALASGVYDYTIEGDCAGGLTESIDCTINHCLGTPSADLIISEIVDGTLSGGRPRFVEVTNCGSDMIDMSAYSLGNFNNGGVTLGGGSSSLLSGVLMAGESFVFEYDSLGNSRFNEVYGVDSSQLAGGGFINGDDVVALFFGLAQTDDLGALTLGEMLDVYGVVGTDGSGEAWEYTDGYASRNPDSAQTTAFDPSEWTFGLPDSLDGADDMVETDEIDLLVMLTTPFAHVCSAGPGDPEFVRGDTNADGMFNIADIINLLGVLFPSGSPSALTCDDSGDTNDDGMLNIADAVNGLGVLFPSGSPASIPAPFGACGVDPTMDALGCDAFAPCP